MMTCTQFDERLDSWLAGDLAGDFAAEMDRHLAACESCRASTAQMRGLLDAAASLTTSIAPPRNLWPGIAARLEDRHAPRSARQLPWRRWIPLAAAAVVLVAVTATLTWQLARRPVAVAALPDTAVVLPAGFAADREYVLAAEDLERVLAEERDRLSPATVAVIEENLALIDAAIAEAREALAADPANSDLRALLWGAHRQKLVLLDQATRLTRS